MANFFTTLVDKNLIADWADALDWLLDEGRFPEEKGWYPNLIKRFTNTFKRELGLSENNYQTGALKNLAFPKPIGQNQQPAVKIMMGNDGSEGRDIVRHIRNGIAHGRTKCFSRKDILWIEITDYGKNEATKRKSKKPLRQSAYLLFPATYILKLHKIYLDIEKSIKNNRSQAKDAQKKGNVTPKKSA